MIAWPTPDPSASLTGFQSYIVDTVATGEAIANSVIVFMAFAFLAVVFLLAIISMLSARR